LPFLDYSDILKKMTLAPELDGAPQLVRDLKKRGIIAAAGHTDGIFSEMMPAINEGITHATHFFCNMSHFRRDKLRRVAGAVETLLYDDRITGELIADGWHLDPLLMKLLVKVKGIDRVCFVTDAMPATGLPDGTYFMGNVEAIVENGIARLPDNSAYAGSVTTMDVCVRNGITLMELSLQDSLRMATLSPAEIIGVSDRKGSLEKNKDADILIIDKNVDILKTIIRGKLTYTKEKSKKVK
jgi:N-acetylglucosamine-6-phosphate deacetylase